MYKGIDVADHQGVIDWDAVKNNIDFAMIRAGFGSNIEAQDYAQFIRNVAECERLGIPYGVYLYSYALNMDNLNSEIEHVKRLLEGKRAGLGVAIDMEDADGYKEKHGLNVTENKDLLTNMCNTFCAYFRNAGFKAYVYASYNYFTSVLGDIDASKWLAHWGIERPSIDCQIWQYTSDGSVEGIAGRVDMNYFYGDLTECNTEDGSQAAPEETLAADRGYKEGDEVKVLNAIDYDGNVFTTYFETYQVIEVNGNRVVIGIDGTVTAAINVSNITMA